MRRHSIVLILMLALAGCGRGLPQVTPTVAPSPTPTVGSTDIAQLPTQTPIIRLTNTATLTSEETATSTPTPQPTDLVITMTPTPRPFTSTPTPDLTEIALLIPTETETPTPPEPSATPTETSTDTATWTPRPSNTPTLTRTWTPTWTPAPPTLTPFFPTNTPTDTDTPTATNTLRPSSTPRASNTPRPTTLPQVIRPTDTPVTPSVTPSPGSPPPPTRTFTPSPTATLPPPTSTITPIPPTATLSETPTLPPPTNTASPIPPTATPLPPTETNTAPPPTATVTLPPPTASATPTFDATQIALIQLTLIRQGQLTQAALPTWTPVATNVPTNTIQPQEVTPNVVTATPGGPAFPDNLNGITSTPQVVENFETPATEFPTADVPTPTTLPPEIIQRGFPTPLPAPRYQPYSTANLSTYRFSVQPGTTFAFNGAQITGGFTQYAANPAYPGSFVYVDLLGIIHFSPPGGSETPLNESPFFDGFGTDFTDTAQNKNYVRDIGWAPNGQQYFFIVDPPSSNPDKQGAGLWFWQPNDVGPGRTFTLLVDCMPGYSSCDLVSNRPADFWRSLKGQWSSNSQRVLITLDLPNEGRQALTVVNAVTDHGYKITAPEFVRYDYGYWTPDGRIVVSGRQQDGRVIVGVTDGNLANLQPLFDASAAGMFMRDAFMASDGSIVAFGREGDANGPVRLYRIENGGATPISDVIGDAAPGRIDVAEDGSQAVVSASGTQYTVYPSGSVIATEIRLDGFGPPGGFEGSNAEYPTGVLPNSRYAPGQQVQMIDAGSRNVRSLPSLNAPVVDAVNPSEFVGILAGPYDADGFTWWYINTARSQQGWFAGQAGDVSYLNP